MSQDDYVRRLHDIIDAERGRIAAARAEAIAECVRKLRNYAVLAPGFVSNQIEDAADRLEAEMKKRD